MDRAQWTRVGNRLGINPVDLMAAVADESAGASEDLSASARSADDQRLAYSVAEAASALGVSRDLVRSMVRRGDLRSRRLGRRVLIPAAELHRWVQQPATQSQSGA